MTKERSIEFDCAYMEMAQSIGKLSYAVRHKVGSIIVSKNGQVISQGFNGTPAGIDNRCEDVFDKDGNQVHLNDFMFDNIVRTGMYKDYKYSLVTKQSVLHAESNAITKCAKWLNTTDEGTIYITLSPCYQCSKLIIQAGIKRVVFLELYRNREGIDNLINCGITVDQIDLNNKKIINYNKA